MNQVPYTRLTFRGLAEEKEELLSAWLLQAGFESFVSEAGEFQAFISGQELDLKNIHTLLEAAFPDEQLPFETEVIFPENWNKKWEGSFQPIRIADKVYVRASFHPADMQSEVEIVVDPKMAFGTGHHATTAMMMEAMLAVQLEKKSVFDFGCGTGILAILAAKLGATYTECTDIDPQAVINTLENADLNRVNLNSVHNGTLEQLKAGIFDLILANINRNVLLETIPALSKLLAKNGCLLLSGFLNQDRNAILSRILETDLTLLEERSRENWLCLTFVKHNR